MMKHIKKGAAYLAALLFWILLWHLAATKVDLAFVLPKPEETFRRLLELSMTGEFYTVLLTTLIRIATGFAGGVMLGALFGWLAFRISLLRYLLTPLIATLRATPVASFILVVILWIERDDVPSLISLVMVLPIVFQNTILGFEKRDKKLSEMAFVYGFGKLKTMFRVELPQVLPFVLSASKTGMGLAWKAGVAAEVLALPKVSIGLMIYNAKMYLETVDLYAWTVAIVLISVLLEKIVFLFFVDRKGEINASH